MTRTARDELIDYLAEAAPAGRSVREVMVRFSISRICARERLKRLRRQGAAVPTAPSSRLCRWRLVEDDRTADCASAAAPPRWEDGPIQRIVEARAADQLRHRLPPRSVWDWAGAVGGAR